MIVQKSVFCGGVSTMFSEKAKLSSLWSTRLEKVFSKMLYFPGNENRRKFGACFKRYAPQKVGFFSPPFLLPPVFSYVDISSRQPE